ncbi:hypothetical protein [Bradyrhizobium sp. JYMT SZCCT0428]|uniref:hypothetical protein n=1 Tax=Bradyrhizobium sp. JYMT SZCCT0428 TaxID=2807673 RepID=UPI001BA9AB7F|nr:hypothetical protein [Bradyrhizobium sp. JYMT SZCCT0428]MBR1151202.1 hypothetical protein [Bradyrhizobium sp. JYMT SZCCT0428]
MSRIEKIIVVVLGLISVSLLVFITRSWTSQTAAVAAGQPSLWKVVGRVPDKSKPIFVELDQTAVARREIYDEAVRSLCGSASCQILFLAPGDPTPPSSSFKAFYDFGGFNVRHLAYWYSAQPGSGDFTGWDCERAGANGAPLSALCGDSVREAHKAILTLTIHAGTQKACGWPPNGDEKIVGDYISRMSDKPRQEQFQSIFLQVYNGGNRRPDNLSECDNVRKRNAARLLEARKLLTAR